MKNKGTRQAAFEREQSAETRSRIDGGGGRWMRRRNGGGGTAEKEVGCTTAGKQSKRARVSHCGLSQSKANTQNGALAASPL